ncbi:MAG TPA: carboxypeptidase-like regulatory domain-containing protein [Blastocatellia bacterium]|nr:carboxypeptidase-like regulatory domain-containing protein [Blastocatellia bacterium]
MHVLTRTILLVSAIFIATLQALAITPQQSKEANDRPASIRGRATIAGKPAPNVKVLLVPDRYDMQRQFNASTVTDEDGRFQFTDIAPGSYTISPFAPAFVAPNDVIGRPGKNITLASGEEADGVEIALTRGGVITGRVTNANGQPLAEEQIYLARLDERGQKQQSFIQNFQMLMTDDRGVYRIYGLPAGRYIVGVGVEKNDRSIRVGYGNLVYERTYHPDVTDESKAKIIELAAGGEAAGVDITVGKPVKTYTATGRIVDADTGKPVPDLYYGTGKLSPDGKYVASMGMTGARSNLKGEFRLEGLWPGRYAAIVSRGGADSVDFYSEPVVFEVTDNDVTGLEIKVHRGASISGVVMLEEGSNEEARAKFSELMIGASVSSERLISSGASSVKIQPDGSFRIIGLPPGKATLSLRIGNTFFERTGFNIRRVERDGVEQIAGIEVSPGENITGVKVIVAYGSGRIRGQVKLEGVQLPEGARVFVRASLLTNEDKPRIERPVEVDARGRFVIEGLPAGDYEVSIINPVYVPNAPPIHVKSNRQAVTVANGGDVEVTLTLELNPKKDSQQ